MADQSTMHGSMFILLKRFVESNYDFNTWLQLLKNAGIKRASYDMHEVYPEHEMFDIVGSAVSLTGINQNDLLEKFGVFLVPDLVHVYQKYIDPSWKTFEMLEYTERVMHAAVRREDPRTTPPVLNVTRVNDKLLIIDYYSKRKMASLAIGIIKGIAAHYNESDKVTVIPTTDLNEERVQLKIEFD